MAGQALVDYARLLEVLETEGELLARSARELPGDSPVPACPGFTVRETVRHVGSLYRMVRSWVEDGSRPERWQRDPAPGQPVAEYLLEGLAGLRQRLAGHEPDEYAGTWWPADQTHGFWMRRMAHETTIHRTDVRTSAGEEPAGIDEDIAVDGVDEVLNLWFAHRLPMLGLSGSGSGGGNAEVAVQAGEHFWRTSAGPLETVAARCSSAEADRLPARVLGAPSQVYLWLWGRVPLNSVTFEGDFDAIGQLWALLRLATR